MAFFFSSRRRHTRCYRDWSSDVCSSDLETSGIPIVVDGYQPPPEERPSVEYNQVGPSYFATMGIPLVSGREFTRARSEERRVGKEGTSRVGEYLEKEESVRRQQDGAAIG